MQKNILLIFQLILVIFITSCSSSSKINALKPEPDDATPLVYDLSPSYINLPITIKLSDIENKTNSILTGLIYEDSNIEDDNIELKVWKTQPISIKNQNVGGVEKIKTILPLNATVKYRVGTSKLGVNLYTTKEFHLNGVVSLVSKVDLVNWKLQTQTEFQSLEWNESPTMSVLGKNVPITFLINSGIQLFKTKIEKKIDQSIAKSLDFKPNVLTALEKISTPFQMSQQYNTWLRINPSEMYSTKAILHGNTILLDMGLKCTMESLVGKQPESKFNASTILLKPVTKIPNAIDAHITAISSYSEASTILSKNFSGQEFGSGKKKVKVEKVALWQKKGKMVVALDLSGNVNGTIYLTGTPQYDDRTKEIYFNQMDYALDTQNKLMQTANWLAQAYILKKIQSLCRYSIKPNLEEGKKNIHYYLKNYSPLPGVFINGQTEDIQFQKMQLTNQALIAFLKINGKVQIKIDGLQ